MELDELNANEPSVQKQFQKRVLLIGRADYWPGYTPEVIRSLDWELWPSLAIACDQITESKENERREIESLRAETRRR